MLRLIALGFLSVLLLVSCNQLKDPSLNNTSSNIGYYAEMYRPQYHFSPDSMWMNDPNGLVFHNGEYHLFFQYYPDSTVWGPMHWGHAISEDLVHWEHLPVALYPDSLGYIFSGSAVVDHNNTSGLGKDDKSLMVAVFTHHNIEGERANRNDFQYQSLAYSNDNGRSWTKYKGNPVLTNPGINDFRDPKVIWDKKQEMWVMVFAAYDKVLFYASPNLIDWKKTGEFGIEGDTRLWECPDLFPIKVVETGEEKWILIVSIQKDAPNGGTATSYFVGDFNGKTFIGDNNNQKWLDYGTDNYALVTWSDVPAEDGRRLAIGWMSNWQYAQVVPSEKWRSAMTLTRSLSLYMEGEDYLLRSMPVEELKKIELNNRIVEAGVITKDKLLIDNVEDGLLKLQITFEKPAKAIIQLRFSNEQDEYVDVGYNPVTRKYFIDRTNSGDGSFSDVFLEHHEGNADYTHEEVEMLIYLDHASIELFADEGRCVMTDIFFPASPYNKVTVINDTAKVNLIDGSLTNLRSIWQ